VGLVVDQLALLDEKRAAVARPGNAAADVKQWRVAIPDIEKRTGLDFGDLVRNADTIREPGQPTVGEAQILIGSIEGILPASQTVS
jgi:endonuclease G, mitochondrial